MAHELYEDDVLLLNREKAWHGFGLEESKISKNLFGAAIDMSDEAFAYALAV